MRLSNALVVYNRAFRSHLSAVLRKNLGRDWWQQGIVRRISTIQADIEHLGLEIETDIDALSVLEPKHYPWIVREHREHFQRLFNKRSFHIAKVGGSPTTLMHEVADWRNVNAHPPARDLDPAVVDRAVDSMLRLVGLFDPEAHDELSKLSGKAKIKGEPEHRPNIVSGAESKAKSIVAKAEDLARTIRNDAEREAMDIQKDAEAQAEAIRAGAQEKARSNRASRPNTFVPREDREKIDRVQMRVRQLENEKASAQSELKTARRNIIVLEKRARSIEDDAKRKAGRTLRTAREEAETIRLRPQQSETFQSLLKEAEEKAAQHAADILQDANAARQETLAGTKGQAERILAEARRELATILADANEKERGVLAKAERRATEIREEARRAPGRIRGEAHSVEPPARDEPGREKLKVAQSRAADDFRRRFKPARSGNGHLRSFGIDGWWLNCWVGRTNGLPRASVFAPAKTINGRRIEAQDTPLMESVCASEEGAFEWLRERDESGQIRREARRAIHLFEREERDDEPTLESDALDDDIPF